MNKLPLKDMDNEIINSGLLFIPVEKEKMDFYQKFSAMKLKYLYLRTGKQDRGQPPNFVLKNLHSSFRNQVDSST